MSTEPFIGEIKMFGFNFAPRGYATCSGQTLSIAQNTALFSLLGTIYGGNGQTTFALPNLNGRVPIGQGQSPGTSNYVIGEMSGTESMTLTAAQMPIHAHAAQGIAVQIPVSTGGGEEASPAGGYLANAGTDSYASGPTPSQFYGAVQVAGSTSPAGGNQPFSVLQPFLVINYSIALQGIFPSRN
jgi:microcystin-dependent protein